MDIEVILRNLENGKYDGERTDKTENGVSWGFYIDHGTPIQYREGKGTKIFDDRENIRRPGRRTIRRFETREEKIEFFKKYGFILEMFGRHPEVIQFSKEYYQNRKR